LEAGYAQQIEKLNAELRTATARQTAFELDVCAMQPAARQIEELLVHFVSAIDKLDALRYETTQVFQEHGWTKPLDAPTTRSSHELFSDRLASPASAATDYNLSANLVHLLAHAKRVGHMMQSCVTSYSQEIAAVRTAIGNAKDAFARQLAAAAANGDQQHGRMHALELQVADLNRLLNESRQDQIAVADRVDDVRNSSVQPFVVPSRFGAFEVVLMQLTKRALRAETELSEKDREFDALNAKVQFFQQEAERKADDARKADSDRLDWKRKMQTERHATDVEMHRLREAKECAEAQLDLLQKEHCGELSSLVISAAGQSLGSTHHELVAQVCPRAIGVRSHRCASTYEPLWQPSPCRFERGSSNWKGAGSQLCTRQRSCRPKSIRSNAK
jgi:hypothetical protein